MNAELMIQTLLTICGQSENSIQQIIRKNKSTSQKLRYISLHLCELKEQICKWVIRVLNSNNVDQIKRLLQQQNVNISEELAKHKLHLLLKRKLNKLKKQSFLYSVDSNSNQFYEQNKLHQLQKSVLDIERDLSIQNEELQQKFNISSIIQKSRMSLDTNLKQDHNFSTISEQSAYNGNYSGKSYQIDESKSQCKQVQISQNKNYLTMELLQLKKQQQKPDENNYYRFESDRLKQNQNQNLRSLNQIQIKQNQMKQNELLQIEKTSFSIRQNQLKAVSQKIMKKKKKSVYTTLGAGNTLNKDDLLDNLLQQSYKSCLEAEKS